MDNMFELASRSKARFPYKGMISVEDLWDLPVEALDSIYKTLNANVKQSNEESLLSKPTKQDAELTMQIEIVKRIVAVKQEEAAARLKVKEQKEKKQKIMEILANKQDAELQSKSPAELHAMLDELG
jgi:hypothetical protein